MNLFTDNKINSTKKRGYYCSAISDYFTHRLYNLYLKLLKIVSPRLRWKIAHRNETQWWISWFSEHDNDDIWLTKLLEYFELAENHDFGDVTIVDIGSGPIGILTKLKAREKIAVDPLPIESQDKTIKRIFAYGEKIPLLDEKADCVFIYNTLQHVLSPEKVLKEANRLLKKGGLLYIAENLNVPTDKWHMHSLKSEMFDSFIMKNNFDVLKKIEKDNFSLSKYMPDSNRSMLCSILRKR